MDAKYKPTIGLEIHAELNTKTKMFCACKNDPNEAKPNVNICPVCMGHPGTLPGVNKQAVKSVLKVGIAVGGKLADFSEFDRKNYFYPDIPKGYQISQYKHPLVSGGELGGVKLTRIHLEEDTATSSHDKGDYSLVNFNRAGVPLMELVTEPVVHSAEEAVKFGKELQLLLQYLGVAEANMEKGEMRFEANISVSDSDKLGTKVEVKNLNSFRAAQGAIEYEIKRQIKLLEEGGRVDQETRGWNESKQGTYSQRSKETAHDYRYFPDPDIPKFKISEVPEFSEDYLRGELSETPVAKRKRLQENFGIKDADIEFYINNRKLSDLFEAAAEMLEAGYQILSNYVVTDIASKNALLEPSDLAELIKMIVAGEVSSRGAKDVIAKLAEGEKGARIVADKYGFIQKNDLVELGNIVNKVLSANEKIVADYKGGKAAALQFLIGQCMKEAKGSGNPAIFKDILVKILG